MPQHYARARVFYSMIASRIALRGNFSIIYGNISISIQYCFYHIFLTLLTVLNAKFVNSKRFQNKISVRVVDLCIEFAVSSALLRTE